MISRATEQHTLSSPFSFAVSDDAISYRQRLTEREPEALARFFDDNFESVKNRIRVMVRNQQDTEDLTQEVFLRIHRALPRFDPEKRLAPWISTILTNRVRDHWRARRSTTSLDGTEEREGLQIAAPEAAASDLEREELGSVVRGAIERLPRDMRTVLRLRTFDELSFESIGRQLQLTPDAARKRYSRAMQSLRDLLPAAELVA
ncbi:MAG: RNA polymerase sigma-70 factor (ECF subfamily) [Planctomycetota bacterium]|jgi:RNA polymerase sigma-70 factor (ECF subfamily)